MLPEGLPTGHDDIRQECLLKLVPILGVSIERASLATCPTVTRVEVALDIFFPRVCLVGRLGR
jgi:hypothetical protein